MGVAYFKYLDLTEEAAKKTRGRGQATLTVKKPKIQDKKKDTTRNRWSIEAQRCFKQARRSEQVAYRAVMMETGRNPGERSKVVSGYNPGQTPRLEYISGQIAPPRHLLLDLGINYPARFGL